MAHTKSITAAYRLAHERYSALGVNVDRALKILANIPISLQCWQGDDVSGFENPTSNILLHMQQKVAASETVGGGLAVTGNYPGKARTPDELRADLEKALSLIPGRHRVNLHAMYGEFGGRKVDRDEIDPAHFKNWIAWAKARQLGLDFNPTCFAHPKAVDGFTLSHRNKGVRSFWIEHYRRSREHQPHRRLGDRHAQSPTRPARRLARTSRHSRRRTRRRLHHTTGASGRGEGIAVRRGVGLFRREHGSAGKRSVDY